MNIDAGTFTPQKCIGACKDAGFPIAGTEYGRKSTLQFAPLLFMM